MQTTHFFEKPPILMIRIRIKGIIRIPARVWHTLNIKFHDLFYLFGLRSVYIHRYIIDQRVSPRGRHYIRSALKLHRCPGNLSDARRPARFRAIRTRSRLVTTEFWQTLIKHDCSVHTYNQLPDDSVWFVEVTLCIQRVIMFGANFRFPGPVCLCRFSFGQQWSESVVEYSNVYRVHQIQLWVYCITSLLQRFANTETTIPRSNVAVEL